MDLQFDSQGNPANFYHSYKFCDCNIFSRDSESCQFDVCGHNRPAVEHLQHFATHEKVGQIAMLYIDSKVERVPERLMGAAARRLISLVEKEVFSKGYQGIVLIGGPHMSYLTPAARRASKSRYNRQIFVVHDAIGKFEERITEMAELDYPNKMMSAGIARILKWAQSYEEEAIMGRINKARGVISDTIIWTLQSEEEYDFYYQYGARGMITNNVEQMVEWAKDRGYELYKPGDVVCASVVGRAVTEVGDCGCDKSGEGCEIDEVAEVPGSACRCVKQGWGWFSWCKGDVVGCEDIAAKECLSPDKSVESCRQGGGDCEGY